MIRTFSRKLLGDSEVFIAMIVVMLLLYDSSEQVCEIEKLIPYLLCCGFSENVSLQLIDHLH